MSDKQKTEKPSKGDKVEKADKTEKKKYEPKEESNEMLIRIMGNDIPGSKSVFVGLTKIKGVSWAIANATVIKLGIPKTKKISELSKEDISKIETFMKKIDVYDFLKNRRKDLETGETKHYYGSDLDIRREFDIKRMKEMKSYKGLRHASKLPVRGQRTRSHFRRKGAAMGVKKKKK
ncbi:MAG: 30S ribosomal protein S13 [Nanoarchaeota archaeon]|nr:30S ribosomal protein S13 [Nanoarchaeota archaeon]